MSKHAKLMHIEACRLDACRMSVECLGYLSGCLGLLERDTCWRLPVCSGVRVTTRLCYSSIVVRGRKVVVGVADFFF